MLAKVSCSGFLVSGLSCLGLLRGGLRLLPGSPGFGLGGRRRGGGFGFQVGFGGFLGDEEHLLGEVDVVGHQGLVEAEGLVVAFGGLADVGQEAVGDAAGDGVPDGVGAEDAWELGRGEEGVADGFGGPLREGRGPVLDEEAGADAGYEVIGLAQVVQDEGGQVGRGAGMDQAEVHLLEGVVLAEEHDDLVGAPDGFLQVALGLLDVLVELANLGVVQLEVVGFVVDVLPGEDLAGLVAEGVG